MLELVSILDRTIDEFVDRHEKELEVIPPRLESFRSIIEGMPRGNLECTLRISALLADCYTLSIDIINDGNVYEEDIGEYLQYFGNLFCKNFIRRFDEDSGNFRYMLETEFRDRYGTYSLCTVIDGISVGSTCEVKELKTERTYYEINCNDK